MKDYVYKQVHSTVDRHFKESGTQNTHRLYVSGNETCSIHKIQIFYHNPTKGAVLNAIGRMHRQCQDLGLFIILCNKQDCVNLIHVLVFLNMLSFGRRCAFGRVIL